MTDSILSQNPSRGPDFYPTDQVNKTKATCRRCRRPLPAGTGRQWYNDASQHTLSYYCPDCDRYLRAKAEQMPAINERLDRLNAWLDQHLELIDALMSRQPIYHMVFYAAGLHGAELAGLILERVTYLPDPNYATIYQMAVTSLREVIDSHDFGC